MIRHLLVIFLRLVVLVSAKCYFSCDDDKPQSQEGRALVVPTMQTSRITPPTPPFLVELTSSTTSKYERHRHGFRLLQDYGSSSSHLGRTVVTFLYMAMLLLCFVTPLMYYMRLYCDDRMMRRRLRDMQQQHLQQQQLQQQHARRGQEDDDTDNNFGTGSTSLDAVLVQLAQLQDSNGSVHSNNNNTEESRALRRKYIAERRARILQLFTPVRMVRHNTQTHAYTQIIGVLASCWLTSSCGLKRFFCSMGVAGIDLDEFWMLLARN